MPTSPASPTPSLLAWLDRHAAGRAGALRRAVGPGPHPPPPGGQARVLPLAATAALLAELDPHGLPPELHGATPSRKLAYLSGRLCAELAIEGLGLPLRGVGREGRAPRWPAGVSGSIAHTDERAYALVVPGSSRCIGIDSEALLQGQALDAVREECLNGWERQRWAQGPGAALRLSLIYAAKEAFFKAVHRRLQRFVAFDEVAMVDCDVAGGHLWLRPEPGSTVAACFGVTLVKVVVDAQTVHTVVEACPLDHPEEPSGEPAGR